MAIVHVLSLLNNTFVTLTALDGKTVAWSSGGTGDLKVLVVRLVMLLS